MNLKQRMIAKALQSGGIKKKIEKAKRDMGKWENEVILKERQRCKDIINSVTTADCPHKAMILIKIDEVKLDDNKYTDQTGHPAS